MIHWLISEYLYNMKKNKILHVRLTELQFERLTETLIAEEINQSRLIREMIEKYTNFYRINKKNDKLSKLEKNQATNIKN